MACSPGASDPSPQAPPTPAPSATTETPTSTPSPAPTQTPDAAVSLPLDALGAVDRALQLTPGAVVELDLDDDDRTWEVGILRPDGTGVEIDLDVATGEQRDESSLELDDEQRTAPAVTASAVIGIALGAVPGAVEELDLDTEDGVIVWEVKVSASAGGEYDLDIDAATGAIVKQERDD